MTLDNGGGTIDRTATSPREHRVGITVLAVIGGLGLLLAVVGAVASGVAAFLLLAGLTMLVLGLGAVIVGRPGWALITSRKRGAGILAAGLALIIGVAALGPAPQAQQVGETAISEQRATPSSSAAPTTTATSPVAVTTAPTTDPSAALALAAAADRDRAAAAAAQSAAEQQAAQAAAADAAAAETAAQSRAAEAARVEADRQAAEAAQAEANRRAAEAAAARAAAAAAQSEASAPSAGTVTPGAFCSTEGAAGVTVKGTPMVCSTKVGDSRARWRSA